MAENETTTIDWNGVTDFPESVLLDLKVVEIGSSITVRFEQLKQIGDKIIATVSSDDMPGDTLWLKGSYGPQNGLLSLIKAVSGGDNIEGSTVTYTKVESDKSPARYAHLWQV